MFVLLFVLVFVLVILIALLFQVHRSPSNITEFGKAVLATNPQASHPFPSTQTNFERFFLLYQANNKCICFIVFLAGLTRALQHTGSLGIAISEAVEVAAKDPATNYALGSVRPIER